MHAINDESLVLASREGNQDAFAELIERYQGMVLGVAYNSLRDFTRSEDVAQQTFVTAWEQKFNLSNPAQVGGWLCGIAKNLVRNERRKHSKEQPSDLIQATAADESPSVAEQTIELEESEFLWKVVESIPGNYRDPMLLFYREDNSISDVAAALDLSDDVVRQRLSRGRKMLSDKVTALVEESLGQRRTSHEFVAGVLVAIPSSAGAKAAGGATAAAVPTGLLGAVAGPLIGVAGAVFGCRKSLQSATSDLERRFIWKMIWGFSSLVALMFVALAVKSFLIPASYQSVASGVIWGIYAVVLTASIIWGNRIIKNIKQQHGTDDEKRQIVRAAEPASVRAASWNLVGGVVGSTAWMAVISFLNHDWLGLFLVSALVTGILAFSVPKLQTETTAKQQMRINWMAVAIALVGALVLVIVRWNQWRLWEWI